MSGEIVSAPPNTPTPPETGYTPFWEKRRGLLYATNQEAAGVNLSVGSLIRFNLRLVTAPSGATIREAYDLSNYH